MPGVADASGAVIAGAKVTLINTETGRKSEATASSDGLYRFSSLAPGVYKLTVEREGFKKKEFEKITVSAEAITGVDVMMETGVVSETVTVSSEAAVALETENANVSRAISTVDGVIGDTAEPGVTTFEVTGDFHPAALVGALNAAGFSARVT